MHYFPTLIMWCDTVMCGIVMWHFPTLLPCIVSPNKKRKEKEKKRIINNDLAILPSHDINQVHLAFDSINPELQPRYCIVDLFPNCFSFYPIKYSNNVARRNHIRKLNNTLKASDSQPQTIIVVTDTKAKTGYHTISIAHGWWCYTASKFSIEM